MPLSLVISQQLDNAFCPVLNMSMNGHLTSAGEACSVPVTLGEATSGKFLVTFLHPEATTTDSGKQFLRALAAKNMIKGLFVDEVHQVVYPHVVELQVLPHGVHHRIHWPILHPCSGQGLSGHWESIRPGLLRNIFSVKVHMDKAPICVLTATITSDELAQVKTMIGRRKEPLLVADGPIQSHSKICFVRRPSSDVPLLGRVKVDGSFQPGDLDYLRTIVLDEFISTVKRGPPYDGFKNTVIFFRYGYVFFGDEFHHTYFRSAERMVQINCFLLNALGMQYIDSSPWAMNHSSLSPTDEGVLMARKLDYILYLTTNRQIGC